MRIGNWRPGRPASVLAALLTAVACTACGSSGPPKVPATAAAADACLLATQSDAQQILGAGTRRPRLEQQNCDCAAASVQHGARLVSMSINIGDIGLTVLSTLLISPAPAAGVGHSARCGAAKTIPGTFELFGAIGAHHQLVVLGPSCAIDAQFARQAYSRL